jgi:vacuolar-type H+-ATPase subunit H
MFRIIKWFLYGFIIVLLWQIAGTIDDNREQIGNSTLRLSSDLEESARSIIKNGQKNIEDVQQNLADSVKQASKQYINEIMK